MTVPAFSLPAVLPGAPPSPMGTGAAGPWDKAGLFEGLLAGAVQAEQEGWSATGAPTDDQPPVEATAPDDTIPAADAGLMLMVFAPAAAPLAVPTTSAPSDTVEADTAGGSWRSPLVAGSAANDILTAASFAAPGDGARMVLPEEAPAQRPSGRLGDLARFIAGAGEPGSLSAKAAALVAPAAAPIEPRPDRAAAAAAPQPTPVTAPPTAAVAAQAAVQPAMVAAAAAAPLAANDIEMVETAAITTSAVTPAETVSTDTGSRRAPGASRIDRRDAASRAGAASASPFAPKSDLLAATVAAATSPVTGEVDVGSDAAPDLAALDTTEAPETRQPALIAETRAQATQATAAAIDAAAVRGSPETVAKMAADIVRKLDGQSTRFDLQLDPHGMGKVDVAIEIDRAGKLTAAMSFDSAQSAADLRGRAGELRLALEQAGFDIAEGGLTFDLSGQNAGFGGREAGQQERAWNGRAFQRAQSGADDADLSLAATPSTPSRWTRSGVDIRI